MRKHTVLACVNEPNSTPMVIWIFLFNQTDTLLHSAALPIQANAVEGIPRLVDPQQKLTQRLQRPAQTTNTANNLRAVVEVVPMVAGANPVVIGGGIVGLVVGVSRRVVQLASLGVLAGGLGVESSSGLTVESLEHFCWMRMRSVGGFYRIH
jgi:hypothetical protein